MANPHPDTSGLQPLKKGPDPRRNLRGVPKDAIAARKLIRQIGAELVALPKDADGNVRELTRFELMIRAMFGSKAPADRAALLKALAPGLLKDELDVTSGGEKIEIVRFDYGNSIARIAGGSESDTPPPGED